MKRGLIAAAIVVAMLAVVYGISAISRRAPSSPTPAATEQRRTDMPAAATDQRATLADTQISRAQIFIQRQPNAPDGYIQLAAGYIQKARETGDFSFNQRAEAALNRASEIDPNNYDALKLRVKLLLSNHRFAEARDMAQQAVAQRPRDFEMHGALVDAHVELGNYNEAEEAVQAMLRIRPYTPSYARLSYLHSLRGDTRGAIAAMRMAQQAAGDPESLAWCSVHLGDELLNTGRRVDAEREYDRALFTFPDYHYALAGKARSRIAAGDMNAAVEFYKRAQERVPLPEFVIALGNLYAHLHRNEEAQRQYDLVEFIERSGSAAAATYSRNMAVYWADRGIRLDEALAIARRERETRADIYTSDALAWCLFKKGQLAEAKTQIEEAMRLGTRDPMINYHAGMIYQALGDRQRAARHLHLAIQINPTFDVLQAEIARRTLRAL